MDTLSYVAIGILVVAIIFMLVPVIGGTMDSSMPALGASSKWNATYNTALKTGSDFWQTLKIRVLNNTVLGKSVHPDCGTRWCGHDCGLHRPWTVISTA